MISNITEKFARKLVSIRRERGLSQEELALLCGVDRTYVGRMREWKELQVLLSYKNSQTD